ncbi:MAG: hypothetical protein KJ927_17395 [Candidatus Eisenbacteria bacterium]|nr:hypothetical protein [Candidatus Eisenbacteria bacterium]MBU1950492.1 hypothetical protein [Candidatus Eisenbacteria bacterium]
MICRRRIGSIFLASLLALLLAGAAPSQERVDQSDYLEYARSSADWTWAHLDEWVAQWKEGFDPENVFGYRAPGRLLEMAVIYATLCEWEDSPQSAAYAARAKEVLLSYGGYRSYYPESVARQRPDYADGVPALPDFFTVMRYIRTYDTLKRLGKLSSDEAGEVEGVIVHSIDYLLRTAEWGTMNRTMLRAESFAWAVRAIPGHPRSGIWEMQRKALGDDNWGNWEIEDATIYHGVWLYSLMGYADCLGLTDELFKTPEMYYYAQYFLNLICPADMVPDFGDANWMTNWSHYLVFFEAAAKQYENPQMKWAALAIARHFIDFNDPTNVGLGYFLMDCYRWGSDDLIPEKPLSLSREVMEDVQGKKIVFRDGWEKASTYLLLNYRDEGDGGLNFRDYLRDAIPVEEEKMTHGHADENSLVMLMSGGSVLLHDGGYRDYMPSGPFGAYRQDYFHNRLCVRPEKIWMGQEEGEWRYSHRDAVPGQSILEFLHNAGSYRIVRTQKVDFISLPEFDYSRTRLIDDKMGYEWDRIITYIKDPEVFVVFDIFKSRIEEYFTLANLWHTRVIHDQGENWYDTGYDKIGGNELDESHRLLIAFPTTHFRLQGTESERRHYQDETLIHQTTAHHFELGGTDAFVTVLMPHPADVSPGPLAGMIRPAVVIPETAGAGVILQAGPVEITIGIKQDLRMDMCRDFRRPRYTFESGKIQYGDLITNGDFVFASKKGKELTYTIVNMTKAIYKEQVLFEAKPSYFGLAFDASPETKGVGKVRYWRGTAAIR